MLNKFGDDTGSVAEAELKKKKTEIKMFIAGEYSTGEAILLFSRYQLNFLPKGECVRDLLSLSNRLERVSNLFSFIA